MKKSELELLHDLCKAANDPAIPVAEFNRISDDLFEKSKPFHQRVPKPKKVKAAKVRRGIGSY